MDNQKHWKKLANWKINQLKNYLEQQLFLEGNTVHYIKPVSFTTLVKCLALNFTTAFAYLKELDQKLTSDLNQALPEKVMLTFLLHFNFDFLKYTPTNFYDFLQKFGSPCQKQQLITRSLVVTIMGHVDHGKTTLLDVLRNSSLAKEEKGAITQKIGGYQIFHQGQKITFLDTPGHQLFAKMRSQGASITDLVVLVIAGDEGIKPQTLEAIKHARAAKVPIVGFVNKMELSTSNLSKIERSLAKEGLVSYQLGGNFPLIGGSCHQKQGINQLLDQILATAKLHTSLLVNTTMLAQAVVIDSFLEKQGVQIALMVKQGILKLQDHFFVNGLAGKVKSLQNEYGKQLTQALPGEFLFITGLHQTLPSGSVLYIFPNEKMVKQLVKDFQSHSASQKLLNLKQNHQKILAKFWQSSQPSDQKIIKLLLKFGNKGIEEVFSTKLDQFEGKTEQPYQLQFLRIGVGPLSLSDYHFALANQAQILTFDLPLPSFFEKASQQDQIKIKNFNLLHLFLEHLTLLQKGQVVSQYQEKQEGTAQILKVFNHSQYGKIAGCLVKKGAIRISKDKFKLLRKEQELAKDLKIKSLKQEKQELSVALAGQECGIVFYHFTDFLPGDLLIQYQLVKKDEEKL